MHATVGLLALRSSLIAVSGRMSPNDDRRTSRPVSVDIRCGEGIDCSILINSLMQLRNTRSYDRRESRQDGTGRHATMRHATLPGGKCGQGGQQGAHVCAPSGVTVCDAGGSTSCMEQSPVAAGDLSRRRLADATHWPRAIRSCPHDVHCVVHRCSEPRLGRSAERNDTGPRRFHGRHLAVAGGNPPAQRRRFRRPRRARKATGGRHSTANRIAAGWSGARSGSSSHR